MLQFRRLNYDYKSFSEVFHIDKVKYIHLSYVFLASTTHGNWFMKK